MSREVDVRNFDLSPLSEGRRAGLEAVAAEVSDRLPGDHRVRIADFDATTGNPSVVASVGVAADGDNSDEDVRGRALAHVSAIGPVLGLDGAAAEFAVDPVVQETSSGAKAVNLQQRFLGIPVFEAAATVRFDPRGHLTETVGSTISVNAAAIPATVSNPKPTVPVLAAVRAAARHVASPDDDEDSATDPFGEPLPPVTIDVESFTPRVVATFQQEPNAPTVLEGDPLEGPILASLVWFPLPELLLAWDVLLTLPDDQGQYQTIVAADAADPDAGPQILFCQQKMRSVVAVGNVHTVDGSTPRQMMDFPVNIGSYRVLRPVPGQNGWQWCTKCQGLAFSGGGVTGPCPAGGLHDHSSAGTYSLLHDAGSGRGQDNWRWCSKCQGLAFNGAGPGNCPAGGVHDHTVSGNYTLWHDVPLAPGQDNWRWCSKCQGLAFNGIGAGACPAGGVHDHTVSGNYTLWHHPSTGIPGNFPPHWVEVDSTLGNATFAHEAGNANPVKGSMNGGTLTFDAANPTGMDQFVTNVFYYCSAMHDLMYLLGFQEANGNFQQNNFGLGGQGSDRVDASAHPGAVWGTANMSTPVDGSSPIMNMGLVPRTQRHTALDSSVVYHEFMHGVTNRLVGGPMNVNALNSIQSGGMGEGWGDYIGCTINNTTVVGDWVVGKPGGIRDFPYDANFPDHFGNIGTGRYTGVHAIGEIWCATLMELNRRSEPLLAAQLVVDALKLSPANPSFLNMRDAILAALAGMLSAGSINGSQHAALWLAIWGSFAKFGMGPQATSNGAQLTGIVPDFTVGQDNWRWCSKCQGLAYNGGPTPGTCPAGGQHDHTVSGNYDLFHDRADAPGQDNWRWCSKCQGLAYNGGAPAACPAGGQHNLSSSGNYTLIHDAAGAPDQSEWRWCGKCQGLAYNGGILPGSCPAGGQHDHSISGNYTLLHR